jgi:hypothetical protein
MTAEGRKPCIRCLLAQAGEIDLAELIAQSIAVIPSDKKADDCLYKERLDICEKCSCLVSGTCTKCGCYVELRAAKKSSHCPAANRRW